MIMLLTYDSTFTVGGEDISFKEMVSKLETLVPDEMITQVASHPMKESYNQFQRQLDGTWEVRVDLIGESERTQGQYSDGTIAYALYEGKTRLTHELTHAYQHFFTSVDPLADYDDAQEEAVANENVLRDAMMRKVPGYSDDYGYRW